MILLSVLGDGWVSAAYVIAFRIPNLLRDLLGEGALSSVIVSRLGVTSQDSSERAQRLIRSLFGFWGVVLVSISALGMLGAPHFVPYMSPGFEGEQLELTIFLTRVIFPYIFLAGMAAMTMGVLHHLRIFGWGSSGSVFSNITVIILMVVFSYIWGEDPQEMSFWFAIAMLLGGVASWLCQLPGLRGTKVSILPSFNWKDPEMMMVLTLLGPAVVSVSAVQVNVLVNQALSTLIGPGAPTSLYAAFRLMQYPVGIVGVSVATVLLPKLVQFHGEQRETDFSGELSAALVNVSFLILPAIGGLYVIGFDLIDAIFGHGRFGEEGVTQAWFALQGYLVAIFPYACNKSLIQGYFSRSDTTFPLYVSFFSIVINGALNWTLVRVLGCGVGGLALGTSCVLLFNCIFLTLGLQYRHQVALQWEKITRSLGWMLVWSAIMVYSIRTIHLWSEGLVVYLRVALVSGAGLAVYFSSWALTKKITGHDFRKIALSE